MLIKFPKTLKDFTGYVVYEPDNYDKTKQYQTVFLFHGQGHKGDGSKEGLNNLFDFIGEKWNWFMDRLSKNQLILVAPQLPWGLNDWPLEYATETLKWASTMYSVDQSRKYLIGISLGGQIAWGYPASSPQAGQEFAAIVAICCVGVQGNFCNIKSPVWAFHAKDDVRVSYQNTESTIAAIEACNPPVKPKMTLLPRGGHDIWGLVLQPLIPLGESQTLWNWLLDQKKEVVAQPPGPAPPQKEIFCEIDLNDGKMFTLYMDKSYKLE